MSDRYELTENGEAETLVAPASSNRGGGTLGWAAFLIGFAITSFAAVTIVANARKTSGFLGVVSKYEEKRWRPYSENCITAPQLCPLGTHCMLKDDTWAACLYKNQCRQGKYIKIECEGPEHDNAFQGEKTYCQRWQCCTLKGGREPSREEPVYTDKLPASYRHTEAVGAVLPEATFGPWQPYCELPTEGCDKTTTTGCPETTVGCEHEESTLPTITTDEDTTTVAITTEGATTAASTVLSTEGTTTVIESNSVTEKTTEADTTSSTTAIDTTTEETKTKDTTTTEETTTAVETTTAAVDTTEIDTTVIDTTVIDTTVIDTTVVDTTVVDITVADTTGLDTTVTDTTAAAVTTMPPYRR